MFLDGGCNFVLWCLVFLPASEGGSYLVFALGLERVFNLLCFEDAQGEDGTWICSVLTVGALTVVYTSNEVVLIHLCCFEFSYYPYG